MTGLSPFRRTAWILVMLIIVPSVALVTGARAYSPNFVPPDCGLNSLFILLELSGYKADMTLLRRSLPPQSQDGYSLLDLKNAASELGYPCRGVAVEKGQLPPHQAALAFLKGPGHGHFIVIRRFRESDTNRVQILDPPSPPVIVDYVQLTSDPHWSGRLLVCESMHKKVVSSIGVPLALALVCLCLCFWFRLLRAPPRADGMKTTEPLGA
jgi:hypothetical protein